MPYSSAALRQQSLSRCSARVRGRHLQLVELPVRITRPVHHHVVLAREVEPFACEFDVAGAVHHALNEVGVTWQVVTGHLGRPRSLLEVGATEAVHPPHERRQHVAGSVGPYELQRGHLLEYPFDDEVHQVVQKVERHEADVVLVCSRNPVGSRCERDARTDFDVHGDRKIRRHGRLPQRPELRLAVQLPRLQRDPDLHNARVVGVFGDFAQRAGDVVGIDPDGAAEPIGIRVVLEPARHHELVVCCRDRGAQMAVGHVAPRHRVQNRDIDAALAEQLLADELGVRPGIAAFALGVRGVLAAGGAVPVHLVVREPAALERFAHEPAQIFVRLAEDVHAGVDHRRPAGLAPLGKCGHAKPPMFIRTAEPHVGLRHAPVPDIKP